MLNQLLSEMGALRWELRCPQNLQPAKPQCYELHRNGALLAYISVAAADKAQENLLLKMLAAIDFELGAMVLLDDADTKLPLLQDYAATDINFTRHPIVHRT